MPDQKSVPQQTIRVFGQAEQHAYERTVSMREVTFTCGVCHQQVTQLRYPGPPPRYCSEDCRATQAQILNQERVRKQREKRQANRGSRRTTPSAASPSRNENPSSTHSLPLLASKLSPPRLPTPLVERARLLEQLDTTLLHTFTLLQGPPGFGKTTVVNQWITTRSIQRNFPAVAWVSLDAGDNDLRRFWRYVVTACQMFQSQEKRGSEQAILSLVAQPSFAPPAMEEVLTILLNELAQQGQDVLLILDDYHVITEARLHETLTFFLDHLPTTVHVLLLSRSEPPLPLLRWRAKGELCELHGTDLRFSSEETATFLYQRLGPTPLSDTLLTQLDTSLEGWATGLRLLALTLSGRLTSNTVEQALLSLNKHTGSLLPSSPHYRSLLDYFVTEILETQPEPIQRFLLQTSVLSRLSGSLCVAITGNENSAALLETVERTGLFLEALDGAGQWYRYHALFAEAMRREASRRLGEEALSALSLRASYWYEQEALLSEAVEAALLAPDMERTALLIEQIDAQGFFYEQQTMQRWLEPMPENILRAHPILCFNFASALRFAQEGLPAPVAEKARIEAMLRMAEESWRNTGAISRIGTLWAFRALSDLEHEPFSRTAEHAQRALALFPQEDLDIRMRMWHSLCLLIIGIKKLLARQESEALQILLEALARIQDGTDVNSRYLTRQIRGMLGWGHSALGELHLARTYYRLMLSEAREQEEQESIATALLGLASLAFEWNDLETSEQQAQEALEFARLALHQSQELHDRAIFQLALLHHVRGETPLALQQITALLNRLQRRETPNPLLLLPFVQNWQSRLRLLTGDFQIVQQSLETRHHDQEAHSSTHMLETQILQGRLLLAQGKANATLLQLGPLLPIARERQCHYHSLEIQLLLALAHAACNHGDEALQCLQQALSEAEREGFLRLFLNEGEPLARLLRSLLPTLQNKMLRSYTQNILRPSATYSEDERVFHISPAASSHRRVRDDSPLFEPLSAQEKRVLRLLAAGRSNPEIAQELIVSINTIKGHVKNIYRKLNVANRMQAGEVARHEKLL